ncbi:glycosyltransferase [Streptomyces sp. NPDC003444]
MEGSVRAIADRSGTEVDDELLLGQWTVDPTPSGMRASDPYAHAADTAAALPEALDGMDIEMVATFDKDQLRDVPVPDNVRTVDHLPLDPLLPSSAALIHHGGTNSFNAAAAMGVPPADRVRRQRLHRHRRRGRQEDVHDAAHGRSPKYLIERGTGFTLDHGDHPRSRTAHRGPPLAYLTARRQR